MKVSIRPPAVFLNIQDLKQVLTKTCISNENDNTFNNQTQYYGKNYVSDGLPY